MYKLGNTLDLVFKKINSMWSRPIVPVYTDRKLSSGITPTVIFDTESNKAVDPSYPHRKFAGMEKACSS